MRVTAVITVRKYEPVAYEEPATGPVRARIHVEESFSGGIKGADVAEFLQAGRTDGSAARSRDAKHILDDEHDRCPHAGATQGGQPRSL